MHGFHHCAGTDRDWIEQVGEVELIGNFAEIALDPDLAPFVENGEYAVFVSSEEPVLLYVRNRTPLGFEIHALPMPQAGRKFSIRCAYHVMARRAGAGGLTSAAGP